VAILRILKHVLQHLLINQYLFKQFSSI